MEARELELLQAIETMINIKLGALEQKFDGKFDAIDGRFENLESEVRKTNLIIENEIRPNIALIAEAQRALYDKIKYLPEEVNNLKETVSILKFTQVEMAKKINSK